MRPRSIGAIRFCRENVYIRDNFTCQYCGTHFSGKHLTLDHVVPASMHGKKIWTNVVAACRDCNQKKADRTPHEANMPLLKEPRAPHWLPVVDFEIKPGQVPISWQQYLRFKAG